MAPLVPMDHQRADDLARQADHRKFMAAEDEMFGMENEKMPDDVELEEVVALRECRAAYDRLATDHNALAKRYGAGYDKAYAAGTAAGAQAEREHSDRLAGLLERVTRDYDVEHAWNCELLDDCIADCDCGLKPLRADIAAALAEHRASRERSET